MEGLDAMEVTVEVEGLVRVMGLGRKGALSPRERKGKNGREE